MTAKTTSLFKGLILATLSGVVYSLVSVIVKDLNHFYPGQLALFRFLSIFFMCLPPTVKLGQNPFGPREFRLYLILRGISASFFTITHFMAIHYLTLSEATAIVFSSPILVTLFAKIMLKEPCNFLQSVSVVLTVVGIIFMSKLPSRLTKEPVVYTSEKLYGLGAAVCSLICHSFQALLVRYMRPVHQAVQHFTYGLVTVSIAVFLTAVFGHFRWHQCGIESLFIILLGLFSYIGQTLMILALKCEFAGPATTMKSASDIGMAYLFQIFVFHEDADIYGIIGSVLIVFSIVLIGFNKCSSKSEKHQETEEIIKKQLSSIEEEFDLQKIP